MKALFFIVHALLSIAFFIFFLRALLRFNRTPGFDPFARGIYQITDPIIQPLRKVLHDIQRVELASVLVLFALSYVAMRLPSVLTGCAKAPEMTWIIFSAWYLAIQILQVYWFFLLAYVLMSWVNPTGNQSVHHLLRQICAPILRPIRAILPPIGGIDFSPLVPFLLIGALLKQFGIRPPCL